MDWLNKSKHCMDHLCLDSCIGQRPYDISKNNHFYDFFSWTMNIEKVLWMLMARAPAAQCWVTHHDTIHIYIYIQICSLSKIINASFISQIYYERSFNESYLCTWDHLAVNQGLGLYLQSPHTHITILPEENSYVFSKYWLRYMNSADKNNGTCNMN